MTPPGFRRLRDRASRYRRERAELAHRQGWWLVALAVLLVAWGRLWSLSLDPPGPDQTDWAANVVRSLEFQLGCVVALLVVGALVRRSWGQALVASIVVVLTVGAPLVHGVDHRERAIDRSHARALRVLTVNVLVHNTDVASTARRIRAADADVVLVQEYGKTWTTRLPAELEPQLHLVTAEPREDSFGVAVFVDRELAAEATGTTFALGGADGLPVAHVGFPLAGEDVEVFGVHLRPLFSPRGYRLGAAEARELRRRVQDADARVVVAGDFNAVSGSAMDRELVRADLRNAWQVVGRGPGWTWPRNGILRHLPGVRIDHVYVDGSWDVEGAATLPSADSDHRPLRVDLKLRD